jgi:hypothetical protein
MVEGDRNAGATLKAFRYTPIVCFDQYPFPWPPGRESQDDPLVQAIAQAASELVTKRDAWLNPAAATPEELSKRTLTNLYNKRPAWLADAHRKLDEAVFAAYGWPSSITDAEILERLLALNHERSSGKEELRWRCTPTDSFKGLKHLAASVVRGYDKNPGLFCFCEHFSEWSQFK